MNVITDTLLPSLGLFAIRGPVLGVALVVLLLAGSREVRAAELNVLAARASESTVRDVVGLFEKESGHSVQLTYAPVGALRDKIYAGEAADLTIVTPIIIEQLEAKGLVRPNTGVNLGRVGGGIAVRRGASLPAIGTPEELKRAVIAVQIS